MSDTQNETPTFDRESVKGIATLIAHTSVGWTIGNVIGNNTNPTLKRQKAYVRIAAVILTGVVSGPVEDYVGEKINNAADYIAKIRETHKAVTTPAADSE